mmetsp:Transcript_2534/g.5070  ORF Transcript_2534/g.5070 Transcript_2534/m.5070 type:complete len:98 (-) Transcript_2534:229-522(-)|eukprot:CAMPEP_0204333040 /NCGR_PEP_ID=MMETSP0469-20131031/16912_1 /ASSEMBLY_ACC=CAM_ASM_000384 /TAXON_ID=2969 /ORGANISM="Oxyrrhis marina" /LENGTH=97 /DNA_ID=CAMNT_0051316301 /DNA_START=13 /DNA_END=306 /DNA_ORIENTATION=+
MGNSAPQCGCCVPPEDFDFFQEQCGPPKKPKAQDTNLHRNVPIMGSFSDGDELARSWSAFSSDGTAFSKAGSRSKSDTWNTDPVAPRKDWKAPGGLV